MIEDVKAWVGGALIGSDGYFTPTGFAASLTLYHTLLSGSFLLSLIDGSARPAPFHVPTGRSAYNELVRVVQRVSEDEEAYWFYITDPDNALSWPQWIERCHYDHALDGRLEAFERSPAVQGGRSCLGLAGAEQPWLLLHEYYPYESFSISIHGSQEFCQAVAAGVGVDA